MNEKSIEKQIIRFLNLSGYYAVKYEAGLIPSSYKGRKRMIKIGESGTPDIIACIDGKFVGIETKENKEKYEAWLRYPLGVSGKTLAVNKTIQAQKQSSENISKAKGVYILTYSLDHCIEQLKEAGFIGF